MPRACRAYHKAMIGATPGLCVHQPGGTVRPATLADLPDYWFVDLSPPERSLIQADSTLGQPDRADRLRLLAAQKQGTP